MPLIHSGLAACRISSLITLAKCLRCRGKAILVSQGIPKNITGREPEGRATKDPSNGGNGIQRPAEPLTYISAYMLTLVKNDT